MSPIPLPRLAVVPDVRLVAVDMDGSLLDDAKRIDPSFWPLLDTLVARGVTVCPASGRQYATLRRQLDRDDLVYVAENGAHVVRDGKPLAVHGLDAHVARDVVRAVRRWVDAGADVGVVLCGLRSAYVERVDARFLAQCEPYYALLEQVPDLTAVDDTVLKVAVYDFGPAATGAGPALKRFGAVARVLVSGAHWVDVMSPDADKGHALRDVQRALGVGPDQTVAFGDYFNDVGMLEAAHWSFAMDNAHPDVRAHARFVAPSNNDNGVVRTLRTLLRLG
nr:Cof-type HAD-IIB family hydrolase [Cellulomonas xiejunii]